ncbi:flavin reductase family protein [Microtetraspora fusca]|uniref:Flavin reductase family protein n=1 Tax=Microtetraspora fusca TaxID=1997 RepID=A0ABW6VCF9_MICFU
MTLSTTTSPEELLRRVLRRHAAGVTVVTVPGPAGFTATSFTSVSLRPALVSFYLGRTASTAGAVQRAGRFAVHLLGTADAALAARFAASGADRFEGAAYETRADGLPVLSAAPAWLIARVVSRRPVGDHILVVGELEAGAVREEAVPLVHHDGAFALASRLTPDGARGTGGPYGSEP